MPNRYSVPTVYLLSKLTILQAVSLKQEQLAYMDSLLYANSRFTGVLHKEKLTVLYRC